LNTSLWTSSYSIGPEGVLIVSSNAPYWVAWTIPARGFSLVDSASLGTGALWNDVTTYVPIPMYYLSQQLISTNDLTGTNAEFFALIKRTPTQLLVLLPGETNAPNTATGKKGTPTSIDLYSGTDGQVPITVPIPRRSAMAPSNLAGPSGAQAPRHLRRRIPQTRALSRIPTRFWSLTNNVE
jgi:hypothetical protein